MTLIIALGLAYCLDHRRLAREIENQRTTIDDLKMELIDERLWARQPTENRQLSIQGSNLIIEQSKLINRELEVLDEKIKDELQRIPSDLADCEVRPTSLRLQ